MVSKRMQVAYGIGCCIDAERNSNCHSAGNTSYTNTFALQAGSKLCTRALLMLLKALHQSGFHPSLIIKQVLEAK